MIRFWTAATASVLVLALLLLFYPLLLGDTFYWGLPTLQFVPWRTVAHALLRAGEWPWFMPTNGGLPLFANYQSQLLYPPSWFTFLLPPASAFSLMAVGHLAIGAFGMQRLALRLGANGVGAGVAALGFGLSSYLVARLGTYPMICAAAWVPWLLWACDGLVSGGRLRAGGALALFTAMLLLAGHAQTAWYALLLAGAFVGLRWASAPRARVAHALGALLAVLLGACIALPQLVATAEYLSVSSRESGVERAFAFNFSYAPLRSLNWLLPNLYGTPADGSYYTNGAYFEDAVFIGALPFAFALAAVVSLFAARWRDAAPETIRAAAFFFATAVIGFALALGANTPLFPWLYDHVPTFDLFQAPVRWHLWTVTSLCVLAAFGVTRWSVHRSSRWGRRWAKRGLAAGLVLAVVSGVGWLLLQTGAASASPVTAALLRALLPLGLAGIALCLLSLRRAPTGALPEANWGIALLLVVAAELVLANWGLNPTAHYTFFAARPPESTRRAYWTADAFDATAYRRFFTFDDYTTAAANLEAIRASELPNLNALDGTPLFNHFDPLVPQHYTAYRDLLDEALAAGTAVPLLDAAGIERVYALDEARMLLHDTRSRSPAAWLTSAVCLHTDSDGLRAALADANAPSRARVHMLGEGPCAPPDSTPAGRVIVSDASTGTYSIVAERDAWLVTTRLAYPGWVASVDGQARPIYTVNLMFQAVQVPAGQHLVTFTYQPGWFGPALLLALVALVVAFTWSQVRTEFRPRIQSAHTPVVAHPAAQTSAE